MPARMIDFEALWTSDRLASCNESTRVEYTWVYGLADPNGSFELSLRAIWSKVSPIRPDLTQDRLREIFSEFEVKGLLFTWTDPATGKQYGHWTNSDRPGRLPPASERHRYKKFAPAVPKPQLVEYEAKFRIVTESRLSHDDLTIPSPSGLGVGVGKGLEGKGDGEREREGVGSEGETEHVAKAGGPANAKVRILPVRENQNRRKPNQCEYCNETFPTVKEFLSHRCRSKTRGGHECVNCHATFQDFRSLKAHRSNCRADRQKGENRA